MRHFGALAGLDHWRGYGGVILIGRTAPKPGSMEGTAGALSGQPVAPAADPPFTTGGILLRGGSVVSTNRVIRLADATAEALRWQVCEANLIQALGRIRPLRDHGRLSFFVDILCDVPLPIVVDEVKRWERPPLWAAMASEGVIYTSAADVMVARPDLAPTEKAARRLVEESTTSAPTPKGDLLLGVGADRYLLSKRRVHIKRQEHEPTELFLLANGPTARGDLRRRLVGLFGRLDEFKVEGEVDPREAAGAAIAERVAAIGKAGHHFDVALARADHLKAIGFEAGVIATIFERGGATRSELLRSMKPRPKADELDRALLRLSADEGPLLAVIEYGAGRPSTRYSIAPERND